MRRYLVAGNWKMNTTSASGTQLAEQLAAQTIEAGKAVDILVCPPDPYLIPVSQSLEGSGIKLGAQNAYFEDPGAFTGETANEMLLDVGCTHVILGHSERRHVMGETDSLIGSKVQSALSKGLQVILCVGELLEEREAGQTESVLDRQMQGGLAGVNAASTHNLIIAYEPVWAIGTGKTASPEQAELAHVHLRKWLTDHYNSDVGDSVRVLYGGSVKPDNASELLGQPNVDGALVGGASLKAELFVPIIEAAVRLAQG